MQNFNKLTAIDIEILQIKGIIKIWNITAQKYMEFIS